MARVVFRKVDGWNVIPDNPDVPREWRGQPIAFMASDFCSFYLSIRIMLSTRTSARIPTEQFVSIRFRYDNSKLNFIFRQLKRVPDPHLCAVAAATHIISQAYSRQLLDPQFEPLGLSWGKMDNTSPFVVTMWPVF
jgi:hypothetical protein